MILILFRSILDESGQQFSSAEEQLLCLHRPFPIILNQFGETLEYRCKKVTTGDMIGVLLKQRVPGCNGPDVILLRILKLTGCYEFPRQFQTTLHVLSARLLVVRLV